MTAPANVPVYYDRSDHPSLRLADVYEVRVCEGCKHPRRVRVRYRPRGDKRDETRRDDRGQPKFLWRQSVDWPVLCTACQYERQARDYMLRARKLLERAGALRARRIEQALRERETQLRAAIQAVADEADKLPPAEAEAYREAHARIVASFLASAERCAKLADEIEVG